VELDMRSGAAIIDLVDHVDLVTTERVSESVQEEPVVTATRRKFIQTAAAATVGYAMLRDDAIERVSAAVNDAGDSTPRDLAANEDFWFQVQQAYDVDRSIINLNNGGVAPAPRIVLDAMHRHVEATNHLPPRQLWTVMDPQVETVRTGLARTFGCDVEEIAVVRNASEALETCLYGIDLQAGDEVLTTSYDYPRMVNTLKQRELREGIVLKQFPIPTPPDDPNELVSLFERNITPKTKILLVSHITFINGQIFPVKKVVALGRKHGLEVIVDGAHAFGHFAFKHADLDCDYYGTSLHKWLSAPIGTGFLYVRRSKIAGLWPLMAAPEPQSDNIRKFEEIGTHPDAPRLAVAEALTFYESIGPERKEARLRYLRDRWARRLTQHGKVKLYTSLDPSQSCGIATMGIDGVTGDQLVDHLFERHRVFVTAIKHEHIDGIRVTPNTYTTLREVDLFCEAIEAVLAHGLPV
jgi:selenocysteine lyase/cysteine desulfurase